MASNSKECDERNRLIKEVSGSTIVNVRSLNTYFLRVERVFAISAELLCGQRLPSGAPLLTKFGNLSMQEILVVTSAYVRPRQPNGEWKMPSSLGGNCTALLGNQRFSWREIAWPPSLLKSDSVRRK